MKSTLCSAVIIVHGYQNPSTRACLCLSMHNNKLKFHHSYLIYYHSSQTLNGCCLIFYLVKLGQCNCLRRSIAGSSLPFYFRKCKLQLKVNYSLSDTYASGIPIQLANICFSMKIHSISEFYSKCYAKDIFSLFTSIHEGRAIAADCQEHHL